jgi:adenylate kinase
MKPTHILFLGAPGSGKGTQCKKLQKELQVPHLSTGDLLRQGIEEKRPASLQAKQYMDTGSLVPDELMIAIFQERLSMPDCQIGFILDGFPRTLPQAQSLDHLLEKLMLPLNSAVYLAVPDNIIIERLSGRLSCSSTGCGAIYQIKAAPPKVPGICDVCGSKLIQRSDDKADVVAERLNVYKRQTEPLINYYRQQGILREIDGNRSQNEIYGDIIKSMQVN